MSFGSIARSDRKEGAHVSEPSPLARHRCPRSPRDSRSCHTALGYGTTGLSVGQRVFGFADWYRGGTLADCVTAEARNLAPLPGDVDFTAGPSLPVSGLTAWQGLFEHGRLQAGQSVLVHGAAGAVGSMVMQLAREAGAYVIGTGRGADRQTVLAFGAKESVELENGRPRRRRPRQSGVRCHRRRHREAARRPDSSRRSTCVHRRAARGAARRRPGGRLRRRVRIVPN